MLRLESHFVGSRALRVMATWSEAIDRRNGAPQYFETGDFSHQ